jgi:hypothetical protein
VDTSARTLQLLQWNTETKQQRAALIRNASRAAKKGFLEKPQEKRNAAV